jgi:Rrf2 family protein
MLSKKAKYGLKAALFLAREAGRGPILVAELSDRERIPRKFLEAILLALKHRGIVQSRKGRGGGYFLGRGPAAITLGEIVRVFDGPLAAVPCVSHTAYIRCVECVDERGVCGALAMKEVRDATARILDGTTLAAANTRARSAPRPRALSGRNNPRHVRARRWRAPEDDDVPHPPRECRGWTPDRRADHPHRSRRAERHERHCRHREGCERRRDSRGAGPNRERGHRHCGGRDYKCGGRSRVAALVPEPIASK